MVDLDAIRKRCEAGPNPVRYYADGEPYVKIDGCELRNHPIVDALARLDRLEKHIYPALLDDVGRLEHERNTLYDCATCCHSYDPKEIPCNHCGVGKEVSEIINRIWGNAFTETQNTEEKEESTNAR